jgi:hypothetical protein
LHINTNEERREKILEYVRAHPRTTKREVMKFMESKEGKFMSSWTTSHCLLNELISSKKIKQIRDKPGGRDHHLVINDENHFFVLKSEIDLHQRFVNNFTKEVMREYNLTRFKEDKYFHDFIRLKQLDLFRQICWTSVKIQSYIKSVEDRETLNLRLSRVLLDSNRLNNILTSPNEMLDLLKESKIKFSQNDNIMNLFFKNLSSEKLN